jgi:hypothetical protein
MTKYLRNKVDGFIYGWHPILAKHPKCEEVTEEEAFPERFAPAAVVEKAKRRVKKLSLETDDIPAEPEYSSPELSADASRDLPE